MSMKKCFVAAIALFLVFTAPGQAPELGTMVEAEFKVTDIPENWKTESAVIIGQRTEYLFTRAAYGKKSASTVVRISEYIHKRIKLQDKNALEKFSTFNYVTMGRDGNAEYKIIKPNGKEESVDMKSPIEDDNDLPSIYRPIFYNLKVTSQKIAIPNLQIGDIIDYTLRSTINWDMRMEGVAFKPFMFSLANNYATMYQQYRFTLANGMKVQYRNYNGAPNL